MRITKDSTTYIIFFIIYVCMGLFIICISLYFIGLIVNTNTFQELLPSLSANTLVLVIGNFLIAVFIAFIINKKVKRNELQIDACFKELNYLLVLIDELRNKLPDILEDEHDDIVNRYSSLILLQSGLIKKYSFLSLIYQDTLQRQVRNLEKYLTDEPDTIDMKKTKKEMLQIERTILNLKSEIL